MSTADNFFVRWRVRLGYPLAVAVLYFSRPTPRSILLGALAGIIGLAVRAYAAGYLHKQEVLIVTGPYAYTRNPLYLGSAILALGAGVATNSWKSALVLIVYFAVFYSMVMRREANELQLRHGTSFEEYARAVPLFIPRLTAAKLLADPVGSFSFDQYKKNHEWQASVGFLFLLLVLLVIWRLRLH
ncbi:MAG TPA: isoprenylcysteine carboxylmethyltransferase family protein [Candidatus Acidoferrum sp.]|nr:isoprenylcysteine carboxylmethyltransferase family protein [Candidatus Acidoferrum sp.]